jgi:hypothetical protein
MEQERDLFYQNLSQMTINPQDELTVEEYQKYLN